MITCATCGSTDVKDRSAPYEQTATRGIASRAAGISVRGDNAAPLFAFLGVTVTLEVVLILSGIEFLAAMIVGFIAGILATVLALKLSKQDSPSRDEEYDRSGRCLERGAVLEWKRGDDAVLLAQKSRVPAAGQVSSEFKDWILRPARRAKHETRRDDTALLDIFMRAAPGSYRFDPTQPRRVDLGLISRLSSLGFIAYDDYNGCYLTRAGIDRALSLKTERSS